jgi:hypothetical protein
MTERRRLAARGRGLAARGSPVVALAFAALQAAAAVARAADPTASPGSGGDVRTTPAAPGLVGDPLLAILGVALVGIVAVALTLLASRLAERR